MAGGFGCCPLLVPLGEHLCLEPGLNIATVDMPRLVNGDPFIKIKIEKKNIYIYIYLLPTGPRVLATPNLCFLFLVIFCTVYDDPRPIKSSGCLLLTRGSSGDSWLP